MRPYFSSRLKVVDLFNDDEPVYQPALKMGIWYREPVSRSTRTGWFKGTEEDPYQEEISRGAVASLLGVDVPSLIKWENATDLEVEGEQRADYGDY